MVIHPQVWDCRGVPVHKDLDGIAHSLPKLQVCSDYIIKHSLDTQPAVSVQ